MIVRTSVDCGRVGGGGSERKVAFRTVGRGGRVLLVLKRVE